MQHDTFQMTSSADIILYWLYCFAFFLIHKCKIILSKGNLVFGVWQFLILKKKMYGPFLWIGFNCLKARATSRRQFTFYHKVPRNPWYSFYRSWKDQRLYQPWSYPVVLNMGPLDWESSTLTTRPLLIINPSLNNCLIP